MVPLNNWPNVLMEQQSTESFTPDIKPVDLLTFSGDYIELTTFKDH